MTSHYLCNRAASLKLATLTVTPAVQQAELTGICITTKTIDKSKWVWSQ